MDESQFDQNNSQEKIEEKAKVTKIKKLEDDPNSYECCSDENPWLGRFIWTFAQICFIMAEYLIITVIFLPLVKERKMLWVTIPCILINFISQGMAIWAYWKCSFADPGYMPKDLKVPNLNGVKDFPVKNYYDEICNECSQDGIPRWRPPRCYHCPACRTCVFKQDHHCVWVNNCVGAGNAKFFVQFQGYTLIYCSFYFIFSVALGAVRIAYCTAPLLYAQIRREEERRVPHHFRHQRNDEDGIEDLLDIGFVALTAVLVIFSGFFGYFCFDFMDDFLKGVKNNQTGFENWDDNSVGGRFGESICYRMYFGDTWLETLLPINHKTKHNYLEVNHPWKMAQKSIEIEKAVQMHTIYNAFYSHDFEYKEKLNNTYQLTDDYIPNTPYWERMQKLLSMKQKKMS